MCSPPSGNLSGNNNPCWKLGWLDDLSKCMVAFLPQGKDSRPGAFESSRFCAPLCSLEKSLGSGSGSACHQELLNALIPLPAVASFSGAATL